MTTGEAEALARTSSPPPKPESKRPGEGGPKERSWRWYSTPESVEKGQVSVLAIAETLAAMTFYGWVAFKYGTLHLTIACCVAPFLLLRTSQSVALGLHWWGRLPDWVRGPSLFWSRLILFSTIAACGLMLYLVAEGLRPRLLPIFFLPGFVMLAVPVSCVWALLFFPTTSIRILATVSTIVRNPVSSAAAIPRNWHRQIACVDMVFPRELLPGAASRVTSDVSDFVVSIHSPSYIENVLIERENTGSVSPDLRIHDGRITTTISYMIFLAHALAMIPTWIYRWSIKGTSILLFPLALLVWEGPRTDPKHITESFTAKALFAGSIAVLIHALKYATTIQLPNVQWWTEFVSSVRDHPTLKAFFPLDRLLMWQVFVTIGAGIIAVGYLYADRLKNRGFTPKQKRVLDFGYFLLGCMVSATIFSLVYASAESLSAGAFNHLWLDILGILQTLSA